VKFPLGHIVITPGAAQLFGPNHIEPARMLRRHVTGDWGNISADDQDTNQAALTNGARLISVYDYKGQSVWVITEGDRSATTILLPDEY